MKVLILNIFRNFVGVITVEIDSRLRVLCVKPVSEAKVIDPVVEKKVFNKEQKEKEMQHYNMHKRSLEEMEIQRLYRNSNYTRVCEFDCGKKQRRKRGD